MKKFLTILLVVLAACTMPQHSQQEAQAASVQRMRFHCDQDTTRINQLLQDGIAIGIKTPNELVAFYADKLLSTPYVAHTLEGDEELLTINIDELDCTTFIETLYALARTTMNGRYSWRDYAANLENLRYRNGEMGDYSTRMHYISEWILNNSARGNLKEVTADLPHADYLITLHVRLQQVNHLDTCCEDLFLRRQFLERRCGTVDGIGSLHVEWVHTVDRLTDHVQHSTFNLITGRHHDG